MFGNKFNDNLKIKYQDFVPNKVEKSVDIFDQNRNYYEFIFHDTTLGNFSIDEGVVEDGYGNILATMDTNRNGSRGRARHVEFYLINTNGKTILKSKYDPSVGVSLLDSQDNRIVTTKMGGEINIRKMKASTIMWDPEKIIY